MMHQVKVLAKPTDLNFIPRTHTVEGKSYLLQAVLCYAIIQVHLHACTHIQIKSSVTRDGATGTIKQTYLFDITRLNIFIVL